MVTRSAQVTSPPGVDEATLADVVRRLVDVLQPERIYLFGSRARGDASEDSDYDFLAVLPAGATTSHDRLGLAHGALRGLGISADVILQGSTQFSQRAPVVASLAAAALREGRLLYGEPWSPDGEAQSMDGDQEKADLTREWLVKAQHDVRMAELGMAADPPIPDLVVFHWQQAAEKALKGFLAWHDRPLRKTHDLDDVLNECEPIDADFAGLRAAAAVLSGYAVDPRYPGMIPEPTRESADAAGRAARQIVDFVLARLPDAARP